VDQVQKVSAVVSAGISTSLYAGENVGVADSFDAHGHRVVRTNLALDSALMGSSQTVLSQRLAPPPQPVYEESSWSGGAVAVVGLCIACAACIGAPTVANLSNGPLNAGGWFTLLFAMALILTPIAIIARQMLKEDKRRLAVIARLYPRWQAATVKWDHLYYCSRDDVVFLPGTQQMASANEMMRFLYS
jgi:hypothetical protein